MTIKTPTRTKTTGQVTVQVDGNMLRLQFPSKISKAIWKTKQKYKTLGISNTPANMAKAQQIAAIAQMDILNDSLDITLEKYNPLSLEKTREKVKPDYPKVLDLCTQYFEVMKKPNCAPGTQVRYKSYLRSMEQFADADIIKDALKIRDSIRAVKTANETRRALDFIFSTIEWAKRNELILKNAENPYKELKQDVLGKEKQQKPKHIRELLDDKEDNDYRGYSHDEARAIIEKAAHHGRPHGVYKDLIEFLFLTGCRTGEAIGLRWEDVTENFGQITFRHSYCRVSKELKDLKTANAGNTSRKFPCGEKLKQLFRKIYESKTNYFLDGKDFVFHRNGSPISAISLYFVWVGYENKSAGIVETLIKEGKVKTYLKPYATRHSFITWQLKAGQTPANVAKLVGNSPEMIYKHYVSADDDAKVVFEI
ncbi:tyrosine-type recombinase/integrase [Allocoleopsis franciscana]|uniref:Site-specific recombinase XerD n=1 Tax=Allocoleopsis franciscana PCC 7113 TaxID=1173027 RepID=K9WRZ8_9CYAN|nr:tyrosine-type recombinase/integrase [Allocoleopsis franciscana]AFZ22332.1 site-specific recombinase XerD [Allocoleopsis franciscana PCC 7113]